jgi:tripartite-type tricarboxylate transporter receptor subunit TctC
MFNRLALAAAMWLTATGTSVAAQDEAFPARPVRLVVPSSPGGGLDFTARVVGTRLATKWQQQVIVDNRAGAAGIIGTDIVAKATPGGYTLVLVSAEFTAMPFLYAKLPYGTADFAPITMVSISPMLLAAHPTVAIKTFKELLATAKEKPKQLTYASSGIGTTGHLAIMILQKMAAVELVHVPFKGAGAAVAGAVAGETQLVTTSTGAGVPFIKAGRLRPLVVTSAKRATVLPDTPTVAESGVPGYEVNVWFGLLAPAKTPKAVINKIHADVREVLKLPEVLAQFNTASMEPGGMPPAEFENILKAEATRMQTVIKEAGIRLD